MSKFEKTLFGGGRFIFRVLAPVLALCAVGMPLMVREWTAFVVFLVSLAEALLVSLILALYDPRRFRWAVRCVTGIVFCAYLVYAVDEVFLSEGGAGARGGRGLVSPATRAVTGFVVIGLPCLWYTLFGRFSLRGGEEGGAGQELSDKADATDINL